MRKGSYFFVIDAFVAAIIVSTTIVVLYSSFSEQTSDREVFYAAEDLLVLLDSTEIRDLESNLTRNWILNGTINDSSLRVIQQIAYFNVTGNNFKAAQLANISLQGVPDHVNVRILIGTEIYAEKWIVPEPDAEVFFTSKRIVLIRESQESLFPPIVIEVQTWQ